MLPEDFLAQLKAAYPRRDGGNVWSAVPRLITTYAPDADWNEMLLGTQNYYRHCGRKEMIGTCWVMAARTFYGRDLHWQEWATMDLRTPAQIADDTRWQRLEDRARALGFKEVGRERGYSVALAAIEQAERSADIGVARSLKLVKGS